MPRRSVVPVAALGALAALAGCSAGAGGPSQVGHEPSWRKPRVVGPTTAPRAATQPITFVPRSAPATAYNDPPIAPAPSTKLADAVVAAVAKSAQQMGIAPPVPDGRLYAASDELAAVVPEEGVVPYALVEFSIQHHGIIEPSPHLLVVWGSLDDPSPIVDELAPRIPELLASGASARVGVGTAVRGHGDGVVILALQGSAVETGPIPRALPDGGTIHIDGKLRAPFHDPEVFVTREDGSVVQPAMRVAGVEFHAKVACPDAPGRQQVEIVGVDASGSTVLANFPVWCREAPPTRLTVEPDSPADAKIATEAQAEQRLFELVNRDRKRAGLPALLWDERVAEVARAHSREMRTTGVVAHVSPTTGSAADRVKVADIHTGVILENIARAYSVDEAHHGLMNSPGHRANLMSQVATHIGIGIIFGDEVSGQREMFVTQVFIRIPPAIDVADTRKAVRAKLDALRPTRDDAALDAAAQALADDLAHGTPLEAARASATKRLQPVAGRYAHVGSVITAVSDLDAISAEALIGDTQAPVVGVGVAQGPHPELGDKAIWIALIVAQTAH